jgi:acetolactate synthase-1/2/3 large subunit
MSGGKVLTIIDALEAADIQFVRAKHINAAAFMAQSAWHRTGAPDILVATVGPRALNGVNAVANVHQDRVRMIVIAGAVDADETHPDTHQVLDQTAVFTPITKASFTFIAGAAHIIADKAVSIALEGRPSPVHIDLPIAVAVAQVPVTAPFARAPSAPVIPAPNILEQAADWLSAANHPVIMSGLEAVNEDAANTLTEMAERFAIPVVKSFKAKGLLPEDRALSLGVAGLSPLADTHLLQLIKQANLIICASYGPIEMRPG